MAQKIEYQDLVVKGIVYANKFVKNNTPSNYLLEAGGGDIDPSQFVLREYLNAYTIGSFDEIDAFHTNYFLDQTLSEYVFLAKALFPSDWKGEKITLTLTPMVFQKGWDYNLKVVFANYMKATGARLFIENDLSAMIGVSSLIKVIIDNNVIIIEAYIEG